MYELTVYEKAVIEMSEKDIHDCTKESNPEIFKIKELAVAIKTKKRTTPKR